MEEKQEDKLAEVSKDINASCLALNEDFSATNVNVQ